MDPDANLEEQLKLAKKELRTHSSGLNSYNVRRLCELVLALDEWIQRGGFLPKRWTYEKEGSEESFKVEG